ncbi:MAG: phytoene desaturase family protein [Ferruginibacter sp.]
MRKVVIIGSGFSGLSAACFMAKAGWHVTVLEKHAIPGGRARQLAGSGFTFDMGPSWYWMPDVFERFFESFGKKVSDYYHLKRLDPSYRIYWPQETMDIPAGYAALQALFEKKEPGSGKLLDRFLKEAAFKYQAGMGKLVYKPGRSLTEFADPAILKNIFRLDVFTSMRHHIQKFFKHPQLAQLLEFPVLFLGALPQDTPALYSLMNYADIKLGTWYPEGGMYSIVKAMHTLAAELGVQFFFNHDVTKIAVDKNSCRKVIATAATGHCEFEADAVIGSADYHFIETTLLDEKHRSYSGTYWDKRVMAPGCLLYYVGLNKKLNDLAHHSLFFDTDFETHGNEIYKSKTWPAAPLFYVSATSVTDNAVAPAGCENLFFLIPVAAGLEGDTETLREYYFEKIIARFEQRTGEAIRPHIIYKKTYSTSNFISDYNSFKGNAYGLANTLMQTAVLKPSLQSKKIKNLFYTGQLTVPGPGVPPSLISGEVAATQLVNFFADK